MSASFVHIYKKPRQTSPSGHRLDFGVILQQGYRDADVCVLVLIVLVRAVQRTVDVLVQLLPTDRDLPEAFVSSTTDPHKQHDKENNAEGDRQVDSEDRQATVPDVHNLFRHAQRRRFDRDGATFHRDEFVSMWRQTGSDVKWCLRGRRPCG